MESFGKDQTYFEKQFGILTKPNMTLASIKPKMREGILTIVILYVLVLLRGLAELIVLGEQNQIGWLIVGSAFGLGSAWFGLSILFHFIARKLGGSGSFWNTWLLMGYIAAPLILTSLLTLIIYIISPLLKPEWGGAHWDAAHTIIGWVGMIWSWPGLLCFYVLRYGENLSGKRAGIIIGMVLLVTIIGWFMPTLVPGWFG